MYNTIYIIQFWVLLSEAKTKKTKNLPRKVNLIMYYTLYSFLNTFPLFLLLHPVSSVVSISSISSKTDIKCTHCLYQSGSNQEWKPHSELSLI